MNRIRRQAGFTAVEAVLVVVFLAAIGGVSYFVFKHRTNTSNSATANTSTQTPAAPEVKTTEDLTKAEQTLDDTNVDAAATDTTQLDAQLNDL